MEGKIVHLMWMILLFRTTDCFQWSPIQQSSRVINSYIGSNTTLPCQFLLSDQEQQQSQQFHVVLWSREKPFGSKSWEGLASKTSIYGLNQSLPDILFQGNNKFSLTNHSLTIFHVGHDDDTQYQCEMKSSFYTTPSIIKVNVVYKPVNTQIFGPSKAVKHKSTTVINCTARANPPPAFSFFHNKELVQNSTSQQYVINVTLKHHEGEYVCIPWNYYGQGQSASISIEVEDAKMPVESKLLSDEMIAVVAAVAALTLVIIVVAAIMCQRFRSDKQDRQTSAKTTGNKNGRESHIGPGIYGSDASIRTSETKSSNKDLAESHIGPGIYGSDANIPQSNGRYSKHEPAIYKLDRPAIYVSDENIPQSNGRYKPREPELYKIDGASNGPVDSQINKDQ